MAVLDMDRVVGALREVLKNPGERIPLHEPCITGNEWIYVKECLDSGWVSYLGSFVDRFEERLSDYTGVRKAIATVNGTTALDVALRLVGVEGGDEVLVPALTFVATANAVVYCGAVPHFVDSEEMTLGLDPRSLASYLRETAIVRPKGCFNVRTGRRIRAVVPVHIFGHPVDLDPLAELCRSFRIEMVEDAAESIGSFYRGRHTGNWGRCAILSFNGNKTITTGGGGAILTNDEVLAARARHLTTTAKIPHPWEYRHDEVGFNYRMPNLNAAVGCAQLEKLTEFLECKRRLASLYAKAFQGVPGVRFFQEPAFARSNYWLNVVLLDRDQADRRDELLKRTNEDGIMTRPAWMLLHRLPMFAACPRMDLTTAEDLERRIVNLPSSARLGVGSDE